MVSNPKCRFSCVKANNYVKWCLHVDNSNLFRSCKDKCIHYIHVITEDLSIFSSPEPKAQGELIVWDSSRRPCVSPSVHTFKH